jgi:hypothetical protein
MPPVEFVATSLNPRERLGYQLACFQRWLDLGIRCVSFNTADERAQLLQAGLASTHVVQLDDSESMRQLTGRPNPRVLPVLRRVLDAGADCAFLVNGDIYPATSRTPLPLMAAQGDALGFVRTDCLSINEPASAPKVAYYGGIDFFAFSRVGLESAYARLASYAASDAMAFGVPGWDLLLGHMILADGGDILEAPFLLHQKHAAGYDSIAAFAPMASAMIATGRYGAREHIALADEFVELISTRCQVNTERSRLLAHAIGEVPEALMPSPPAKAVNAPPVITTLARQLPGADVLDCLLRQLTLPDWRTLHLMFRRLERVTTPLDAYLRALEAGVMLRREVAKDRWVTRYGATSKHGAQMRHLMSQADSYVRQQAVLELFAVDLYEHGVLNLNLFKYLMTKCANGVEQHRCAKFVNALRHRAESRDELASPA